MSAATWTGRADNRSVRAEQQARLAATSAQENFEHLRRMTQQLASRVPPAANALMKQGLGILNGLSSAVLERPGVAQPQATVKTTPVAVATAEPVRSADARVTPIRGRGLDNPSV